MIDLLASILRYHYTYNPPLLQATDINKFSFIVVFAGFDLYDKDSWDKFPSLKSQTEALHHYQDSIITKIGRENNISADFMPPDLSAKDADKTGLFYFIMLL